MSSLLAYHELGNIVPQNFVEDLEGVGIDAGERGEVHDLKPLSQHVQWGQVSLCQVILQSHLLHHHMERVQQVLQGIKDMTQRTTGKPITELKLEPGII